MQRAIRPEWLLRQAEELAYGTGTAGQPRNADLRRAVSAAYYAVFHCTTGGIAEHVLGQCSLSDQHRFTRYIDHGAVKMVCDSIVSTNQVHGRGSELVLTLRNNARLRDDYAFAFQQLYQARNLADYDHLADFTRPEALAFVDQASVAVETFRAEAGTPDMERFVGLVSLRLK